MKSDDRRASRSTLRLVVEVCAVVVLSAMPAAAQRVLEGGQPFRLPQGGQPSLRSGAPRDVVVDDFNADGRFDIAVAGAGAVSVLLGDPETLFAAPQWSQIVYAWSLASGDFNGDGFPDLMATGDEFPAVFLNQGDGSFRLADLLRLHMFPFDVELSDLDEDGLLDAILGGGGVHLLFGDGQGSFPGRLFLEVPGQLGGLEVDDFDDDGHDDLVTASPRGIDWHRGRGDGEFDDPVTTVLSLLTPPRFLASGDLLPDGLPDLAVAGEDGAVFVLLNAGGGLFREEFVGQLPAFDAGDWDRGFRTVDYDGDGFLDIMTPLGGPDSTILRVFLGSGDGTFALELDVEMGIGLAWVELAELDGDAELDAIVVRSDLPEVVVFHGRGPAQIETPVTVPLDTAPRDLAIADVNQDGAADVVVMSSSTLSVVEADGAGGFESSHVTEFADRGFQSIIGADFGAPGGAEVALTDDVRNEVVIVFFERGSVVETLAHPVEERPSGLSAWDYDRDGLTDFAVVHRDHPELSVLLGPGVKGQEPREIRIPVGSGQRAVVTGDVDADGAADLLATTREGLSIVYGDGAGGFPRQASHDVLASARWLELADVDGDGALDLLAVVTAGIVAVRRVGFSDRSPAEEVLLGEQVRGFEVVDFTGDGQFEAVTATASGAVAVTPLLATGGFGATERFTVGARPWAVAVGDLDGDGRLDAVSANHGSRSLTVLRGAEVTGLRESLRRGDADTSGQVTLTDAVVILNSLFGGAGELACPDAADSDDDGVLTLTDAVRILLFLFGGVDAPPAPGPATCGPDPTPDALAACSVECL